MTTGVLVRGDAPACAALGAVFVRAAAGVAGVADELSGAAAATPQWRGAASGAWQGAAQQQHRVARDLADGLAAAGRALSRFAEALADAQRLEAHAHATAEGAGLRLDADGAARLPADVVLAAGAGDPAATIAVRRGEAAQAQAQRSAGQAREGERRAHEDLRSALARLVPTREPGRLPPLGWNGWLDVGHGVLGVPSQLSERALDLAPAAGAEAGRLLDAAQRWGGCAETVERLVPWLRLDSVPVSASTAVLRDVPVLGVVMTGVGIAVDVHGGSGVGMAVAKNVTATAGATVAAAGAVALLSGGALVGAPVIVGLAVGMAVGVGIGWAFDTYGDDVAGAGRRAASEVGHEAEAATRGAGRAVGRAWSAVVP